MFPYGCDDSHLAMAKGFFCKGFYTDQNTVSIGALISTEFEIENEWLLFICFTWLQLQLFLGKSFYTDQTSSFLFWH